MSENFIEKDKSKRKKLKESGHGLNLNIMNLKGHNTQNPKSSVCPQKLERKTTSGCHFTEHFLDIVFREMAGENEQQLFLQQET